jgi:hypothetical protein
MSASVSTATPQRPTSPSDIGSSESSPSSVGMSNAVDSPVPPDLMISLNRQLVSSAVPKPANIRIVHSFERYIDAYGPRVYGYWPGTRRRRGPYTGRHSSRRRAPSSGPYTVDGSSGIPDIVVKAGTWDGVVDDVAAVRAAVPADRLLKVIIESAVLTDDEIVRCCRAAETAGADYVKTSTGFHPSGGATVDAVTLMADTVGGRLGVKASGGVRTWEAATTMMAAGATRLGTSSTAAILGGAPA